MSDDNSDFIKSSAIMAAGTIVSRFTGLIRNLLTVAALGTALFADTFNVANTIPTILYILLAGGALNAVFVPQLVRSMREDADGGSAFASRLLTSVTSLLFFITALGVVLAPLITRIYAPKFSLPGFETERSLTIAFMRYCLPQILMMGIFVILSQIGNARGKFGPMMWAPVLNNLIGIVVLLIFLRVAPDVTSSTITSEQSALLGIGTTLGFVVQALVLIPVVKNSGLTLSLRFDWRNSNLGKSFRLGGWTLLFVLINQIGYLIIVKVATSAAVQGKIEGITTGVGFTPYSYAYFIFILPHSIITVSVITALLPKISRLAHEGNNEAVKKNLVDSLRNIAVVTAPSSVLFIAFGTSIAAVLYAGSSADDSRQIGLVLAGFAIGLIPFSTMPLLLRGFYAYEDTKSPVIINLFSTGAMMVLAITAEIFIPFQYVTIALAVILGLSNFLGTVLAIVYLEKRIGVFPKGLLFRTHIKLLALSAIAMVPGFLLFTVIKELAGTGLLRTFGALALGGTAFTLTYIYCGRIFKVEEITTLYRQILSRLRRRES
jgi:putative peptidoglycan lipid II flippase